MSGGNCTPSREVWSSGLEPDNCCRNREPGQPYTPVMYLSFLTAEDRQTIPGGEKQSSNEDVT